MTIEGVAARAGVAKTTVYRHWDSLGTLLLDAVKTVIEPVPAPDTGDVRRDLLDLLANLREVLWSPTGSAVVAIMAMAEHDRELARLHRELAEGRRVSMRTVLERAVERGQIGDGPDLELTVDRLAGPVLYRRLVTRAAPDDDELGVLVDATIDSFASARTAGRP